MNINWVGKKIVDKNLVDQLINECVESRHFTNFGKCVAMLEYRLQSLLKINSNMKVILTCNGACAINALVGVMCSFYNKKLKFAVQSFTFPCSKQGLLIDSLVLDIDSNMGPSLIELEEKKNEYDGVLITNCFGGAVDIDKYTIFCQQNNKILLFDNAATPYTFYRNENLCNYGDGSIISFHHTKPIGFGEGGLLIVDEKYYEHAKKIICFGYSSTHKYNYDIYASNYKMPEIAAIYIYQYLSSFVEIVSRHNKLYRFFIDSIKDKLDIQIFKTFADLEKEFLPATIPVVFQHKVDVKFFHEKNIEAKKYYYPLDLTKPISKDYFDRIICFPLNCDMNEDDITYIISKIEEYYALL